MFIKRNVLLTPGPATTTEKVKMAQVVPDICPRENEFIDLITAINEGLIKIVSERPVDYACTLLGGAGTAIVESILVSVVSEESCVLILNNGAYGKRMVRIAEIHELNFVEYKSSDREKIDIQDIKRNILKDNNKITHIAVVHHETTTGILNDLDEIALLTKDFGLELLVDAISSFGAIHIDMDNMGISHLAATSNKNLQGMAGVGFIISKIASIEKIKNYKKKSLYLNLYDQYQYFLSTGQFRFTPPVQTVYALKKAIEELEKETIKGRYSRYGQSWETLVNGMSKLGFKQYVPLKYQSKLICTFYEPDNFNFNDFHDYLYKRGITIYPGKILNKKTFRIGTIGDINYNDIEHLLKYIKEYQSESAEKKKK